MKRKYITTTLSAFFFIAGFTNIQAQDTPFLQFGGKTGDSVVTQKTSFWSKVTQTPWIINVGPADIVDNDLGGTKGIFKIWGPENYYPIHCSAEKLLMKGVSAQFALASETLNKRHFTSMDVNIKYSLKEILGDTKWFDPYALIGGGYILRKFPHGQHTSEWVNSPVGISADRSLNINVGGGVNIWLFPNMGIYAEAYPKFNFIKKIGGSNMMAYSFGAVFKIGGTKTTVKETIVAPSTYKRTKEAEDAANYLRGILNK